MEQENCSNFLQTSYYGSHFMIHIMWNISNGASSLNSSPKFWITWIETCVTNFVAYILHYDTWFGYNEISIDKHENNLFIFIFSNHSSFCSFSNKSTHFISYGNSKTDWAMRAYGENRCIAKFSWNYKFLYRQISSIKFTYG